MSQRTRNVNRFIPLLVATLVAVLAPAAVSHASTASTSGGELTFNATPGYANDVTVSSFGGYVISDPVYPVVAGIGCSQTTANSVTCTTGGVSSIRLNLDDGNDTATATVSQNVEFFGGTGNDTFNGGSQGDQMFGEDGDDSLQGGGGPDLMDGGNGFDNVSYATRTNAVRVDQDGLWDDGESVSLFFPELDNVMPSVEEVTGGSGNDLFVGSSGANIYHGGDGADTINGYAGDDTLFGDGGSDSIDGGYGTDTVDGGLGDDGLMTRDNGALDHVACGDGTDSVVADREDDVAAGCETVDVPPAGTSSPPANTPPTPKVDVGPVQVVQIVERTLTVSATGKISIKISCGAEQKRDCRGSIKITVNKPKAKDKAKASRRSGPAKGGKIVVAKGKFKVKRGRTALASVKASKKSLKRVFPAKAKRLKGTLTISMKNSDGSTTQILKPITLSTKKKQA